MTMQKNARDDALRAQKTAEQKLSDAKTANGKSDTKLTRKDLQDANIAKNKVDKDVDDKQNSFNTANSEFSDIKVEALANDLPLLLKRNAIQNKIIAASNQRCNAYLNYMQRSYSETNFALGFLTTAVGGAGSIVSGASAARALSGAAGILSGTQAEFDQDFFYNQTVSIILTGITEARKSVLNEIESDTGRGVSGDRSYLAYPVEKAIADAIRYHGTCTLAKGIEHLGKTINIQPNLSTSLEQYKKVRDALKE